MQNKYETHRGYVMTVKITKKMAKLEFLTDDVIATIVGGAATGDFGVAG